MKRNPLFGLLVALASVALPCRIASSQGMIFPPFPMPIPRPFPRPFPLPPPVQSFYVRDMKIKTVINDAVAETSIEQTFVNTASSPQEGTYLFPIPEGATPSAFSMTDGDKTYEPRILPSEEAHSIYEGYVRRYRDPALLEFVNRGLIKVSIYPIPAGGERKISIRYTEILKPHAGLFRYAVPISTGRFGCKPVSSASVSIQLHSSTFIKNIYSPTHDVSVKKSDDHHATASWEGANDASDRDLLLYFSGTPDNVGLSVMTYKSGGEDGYFLLLASPSVVVAQNRIMPKHVVFLLDRTGSMAGAKIEQARKSLAYCLNKLRKTDTFDVITFNESPDVLFPALTAAETPNVEKALKFTENIEANGGTNIDAALRAALDLFKAAPGHDNMVVFLTDGRPTVGETDINTISHHVLDKNSAAGGGIPVRIFCYGLGFDVNVPFLDRIADENRGDADYVAPSDDIEASVSGFFGKVSSPLLTDIKLAMPGLEPYDVFPKQISDLFQGSQLVITGRFRGSGKGTVKMEGRSLNGPQEYTTALTGDADGSASYLPRLWAARKLGYLVNQLRINGKADGNKELLDEILRLSKEYGIITEYTSFLVDQPATGQPTIRFRGGASAGAMIMDRAKANGVSGEQATNQSRRARDLQNSNVAGSRYQSTSGGVNVMGSVKMRSTAGMGSVAGPAGDIYAGQSNFAKGRFSGSTMSGIRLGNGLSGAALQGRDAQVGMQSANNHTFLLQSNSVWQDVKFDPIKQKPVKIVAFSDAHFALMRAIPELSIYSSVGDEVIVNLGHAAVQIGKEGKTELTAEEIKELSAK